LPDVIQARNLRAGAAGFDCAKAVPDCAANAIPPAAATLLVMALRRETACVSLLCGSRYFPDLASIYFIRLSSQVKCTGITYIVLRWTHCKHSL
jgi:hypothetical protein